MKRTRRVSRGREVIDQDIPAPRTQYGFLIDFLLWFHQRSTYGFGITSDQIVNAHSDESDGEAAFIRSPQRHEEGKYPYPFMQNLVIDRGNNMEIFNAYFRKDDIDAKKNSRQEYFESGLFDAGKAYTKLFVEEPPSLVRAGPQYEKKIKRTKVTKGICTRIMPFLISIWPVLTRSTG